LKCEKDLLDECELRQEGDRMVENKLLNHIHTLERNIRDSSQRLVAMIEPFVPRLKHLESAIEKERDARMIAIEEVREDLREAIAMTAGVAARSEMSAKMQEEMAEAGTGGGNARFTDEVDAIKEANSAAKAQMDSHLEMLVSRVANLERELEDEREARSQEKQRLEGIIRAVVKEPFDLMNRHRIELEASLTQKIEETKKSLCDRLDNEKVAAEAAAAASQTSAQNDMDKQARVYRDTLDNMQQQLKDELAQVKKEAAEERQRREKAEEDIINNLGDAIISMRTA